MEMYCSARLPQKSDSHISSATNTFLDRLPQTESAQHQRTAVRLCEAVLLLQLPSDVFLNAQSSDIEFSSICGSRVRSADYCSALDDERNSRILLVRKLYQRLHLSLAVASPYGDASRRFRDGAQQKMADVPSVAGAPSIMNIPYYYK